MNTNVNLEAAMAALLFVGGCALLFVIFLLGAHALFKRRLGRMKALLLSACGLAAVYLCLMLVFSLMSRERVLERGEEKYFCEIDCHLAYSVVDVLRTKTVGEAANLATARGVFYVVTVRTRFDEQTVSSGRGDAPLTPNSRVLTVEDAEGASYAPSPEGMRALELSRQGGTNISSPLRPGEAYTSTFIFDLPEGVRSPALLMKEGEIVTRFLIGHENSPLHKKVLFSLNETQKKQAVAMSSGNLGRRLGSHMKGVVNAVIRKLRDTFH
ncbi:MAG TPA: hypothetical protein VJS44_02735 [Pyrinomonadaceae bacterium]|nr:hypothetical protein [Pyrinomonadaceae bacterium]